MKPGHRGGRRGVSMRIAHIGLMIIAVLAALIAGPATADEAAAKDKQQVKEVSAMIVAGPAPKLDDESWRGWRANSFGLDLTKGDVWLGVRALGGNANEYLDLQIKVGKEPDREVTRTGAKGKKTKATVKGKTLMTGLNPSDEGKGEEQMASGVKLRWTEKPLEGLREDPKAKGLSLWVLTKNPGAERGKDPWGRLVCIEMMQGEDGEVQGFRLWRYRPPAAMNLGEDGKPVPPPLPGVDEAHEEIEK